MKSFILIVIANSCCKGYAKYKNIDKYNKIISRSALDYSKTLKSLVEELQNMRDDILSNIKKRSEASAKETKLVRKINWLLCELSLWFYVWG